MDELQNLLKIEELCRQLREAQNGQLIFFVHYFHVYVTDHISDQSDDLLIHCPPIYRPVLFLAY